MTPDREEIITGAWRERGARLWRWAPVFDGYQYLEVPVDPRITLPAPDAPVVATTIERLTFIGSYATFPNGSGPGRPRYRFTTCEGLIVHQERIQ
jgi:hypothetical protein